jgi:hypothetical protein
MTTDTERYHVATTDRRPRYPNRLDLPKDLARAESALAEIATIDLRHHRRSSEVPDAVRRCLVELGELVELLGGPSRGHGRP